MLLAAVQIIGSVHSAALVEVAGAAVRILGQHEEHAPNSPPGYVRVPGLVFDAVAAAGRRIQEIEAVALAVGAADAELTRHALVVLRAFASVNRSTFIAVSALDALAWQAAPALPPESALAVALPVEPGKVALQRFRIGSGHEVSRVGSGARLSVPELARMATEGAWSDSQTVGSGWAHAIGFEDGGGLSLPSAVGVALAGADVLAR